MLFDGKFPIDCNFLPLCHRFYRTFKTIVQDESREILYYNTTLTPPPTYLGIVLNS